MTHVALVAELLAIALVATLTTATGQAGAANNTCSEGPATPGCLSNIA